MDLTQFGPNSSSNDNENNSDSLAPGESVRYHLTEAEREHVRDIARARHASYDDGRTRDESWGGSDDSFAAMCRGVAGELVLSALYDCPFDTEISKSGDKGLDTQLELDGEMRTVDIKTSTYDGPGQSLMVATHHVDERSVTPDAYLRAHVDESFRTVTLQGWITSDELLREEMIEPSPAGDWRNFDAPVDELNALPEPDDLDEHDGASIVRE